MFRADEELFFAYAARGHELLTDDQLARIDAIYHAEKDASLAALETALNSAVGPASPSTRRRWPAEPAHADRPDKARVAHEQP